MARAEGSKGTSHAYPPLIGTQVRVPRHLGPFIARLNEIRREHPALRQLHRLRVHETESDQILCFSRRHLDDALDDALDDVVIVVANLEPSVTHETTVHLDLPALGIGWGERFAVRDELTGDVFEWGEDDYVKLGGDSPVAHVLTVLR
jgi:starch synthase (maltosyl-transferring)